MTPRTTPRAEVIRRIYRRNDRWWIDLRKYGVGRIPLVREGTTRGTSDYDEALAIGVKALEHAKQDGATRGDQGRHRSMLVLEVARAYEAELDQLVARRDLEASTRKRYQLAVRQLLGSVDGNGAACAPALDQDRRIDTLTLKDVRKALAELRTRVTRLGKPYSSSSMNHILVVLNELCECAKRLGATPDVFDPVGALTRRERPKLGTHTKTDFFEVPEVAALLDVLQTQTTSDLPLYEITATLAYTGGRKNEVLGLRVRDLDFERQLVTFRVYPDRNIKCNGDRVVPFWPELQAILRAYLARTGRTSGLVFSAPTSGHVPKLITSDIIGPLRDAQLAAIAHVPLTLREGFEAKRVHPHAFRTTSCAARLQTLDNGAPVSPLVVRAELGHSTLAMIERVYARLGTVRVRGPVVTYRPVAAVVAAIDPGVAA